ncbi:unnamed protein product [Protopolystoma xenopodis]|uniref:Uncharacterized protein n=1 Tax=Protopolystoma xenopodis TaxID=117903 RepID=A0A3S5A608_9PLAT|nr:unnamed protein product [Protopolystoma xenopodis]
MRSPTNPGAKKWPPNHLFVISSEWGTHSHSNSHHRHTNTHTSTLALVPNSGTCCTPGLAHSRAPVYDTALPSPHAYCRYNRNSAFEGQLDIRKKITPSRHTFLSEARPQVLTLSTASLQAWDTPIPVINTPGQLSGTLNHLSSTIIHTVSSTYTQACLCMHMCTFVGARKN